MPDTKVTIIITGLAICRYSEGEKFELIFLNVQRHELDLFITKRKSSNEITGTYNIPSGSMMYITSTDAESSNPDPTNPDKNYDQIVNIDEINGEPIPFRENPEVELTYLSVQGAVCYTAKISNQEYDFWRVTGEDREKIAGPMQIGLDIGIDFTVSTGGSLELIINDVPLAFPQEDDVEYEIKFDNACTENPNVNDFEFYFDVLSDEDGRIEELFAESSNEMRLRSNELSCNPIGGTGPCDLELFALTGRCYPE